MRRLAQTNIPWSNLDLQAVGSNMGKQSRLKSLGCVMPENGKEERAEHNDSI